MSHTRVGLRRHAFSDHPPTRSINPRFGCPHNALIIARTFGVEIDKDVVRRVLAKHYRPKPRLGRPSWLTFVGHAKDSLWGVELFRKGVKFLEDLHVRHRRDRCRAVCLQ